MPTLTISDLVNLARSAGFTGDSAAIAAAVAMAESSGRTDARNPTSSATGLWQIMQSVHSKTHPTWTFAWLMNAQNNAHAAYVVSNGGRNWTPWVAYTSGTYRRYLTAARRAAGSPPGTDPLPGNSATPSPAVSTAGGTSFDPSVWLRIAMFIGGALLLLLALVGASKVGSVLPVGRVLRTVRK